MHKQIPNLITYLRLICVPLLVLFFLWPFEGHRTLCAAIFIIAAVSDWLDGYLARRWQVESPFGAFLDPVADKIIVAAALVLLCTDIFYAYPKLFITIPAIIIIGREICVSALREWMAEMGARDQVKVSVLGKYKTTFQMIAIIFLLYGKKFIGLDTQYIGTALLVIAAALTLISMFNYLALAWPHMRK